MPDPLSSTREKLRTHLLERELRLVVPGVLDATEMEGSADVIGVLPPKGSVVVYYAKRGTPYVKAIEEAISTGDRKKLAGIAARVERHLSGRVPPPREQVLRSLFDTEVVFDVRYAGRTIVDTLGLLSGYEVATATLAYIGGRTDPTAFVVAEHLAHPDAAGYEYLVVSRKPILTDLENAALQELPDELAEMVIGEALIGKKETTEVADVAKEMIEKEKTTWHKFELLDKINEELQSGQINPAASAAALMKARYELLTRSASKGNVS